MSAVLWRVSFFSKSCSPRARPRFPAVPRTLDWWDCSDAVKCPKVTQNTRLSDITIGWVAFAFQRCTSRVALLIRVRLSYFMWRCITVGVSTESSWPVPLYHISHIQNHIKHELVLPYEDVLWKGFNTVPFWNTDDMCVSLNGTLQPTKDLGQCPTLTSIIHVWFPWGPFSFGPCTAVQWLFDSSR